MVFIAIFYMYLCDIPNETAGSVEDVLLCRVKVAPRVSSIRARETRSEAGDRRVPFDGDPSGATRTLRRFADPRKVSS